MKSEWIGRFGARKHIPVVRIPPYIRERAIPRIPTHLVRSIQVLTKRVPFPVSVVGRASGERPPAAAVEISFRPFCDLLHERDGVSMAAILREIDETAHCLVVDVVWRNR